LESRAILNCTLLGCARYTETRKSKGADTLNLKTDELLAMVESLPIDMKTKLVEKILDSLHPSQKEIDALWALEAEERVKEIRAGNVKVIPGEDVFKEIKKRFSK
jgi:putative addiction module component (TIGR02574 family)